MLQLLRNLFTYRKIIFTTSWALFTYISKQQKSASAIFKCVIYYAQRSYSFYYRITTSSDYDNKFTFTFALLGADIDCHHLIHKSLLSSWSASKKMVENELSHHSGFNYHQYRQTLAAGTVCKNPGTVLKIFSTIENRISQQIRGGADLRGVSKETKPKTI